MPTSVHEMRRYAKWDGSICGQRFGQKLGYPMFMKPVYDGGFFCMSLRFVRKDFVFVVFTERPEGGAMRRETLRERSGKG